MPLGETFIDGESEFRNNKEDDYSFRVLCLQQVRKILVLGSREFRGGYWQHKVHTTGTSVPLTEKFYVPDTREEYCNAIAALYDIIFPHFNEKTHNKILDITNELVTEENEDKMKKVRIYRTIFQKISSFLKSKHYFESMGIEE